MWICHCFENAKENSISAHYTHAKLFQKCKKRTLSRGSKEPEQYGKCDLKNALHNKTMQQLEMNKQKWEDSHAMNRIIGVNGVRIR